MVKVRRRQFDCLTNCIPTRRVVLFFSPLVFIDRTRRTWHPADFLTGIRERELTLCLSSRVIGTTFPWPRGTIVQANALDLDPERQPTPLNTEGVRR